MPSLPSILGQSVFRSSLSVPPPPPGFCLTTENLQRWFAQFATDVKAEGVLFGYTVGTLDAAAPEDQDKPRFMIDDQGRFLGMALWLPEFQGWSIGGQVGELMTLVRVKASVALDMAARPLAGWKLADGTAPGVPDLHANTNFFQGTSPDYTLYTLAFTG